MAERDGKICDAITAAGQRCLNYALAETDANGLRRCARHADAVTKAAHAAALAQAERTTALAPELLAFVRLVVDCCNDPQLVATASALVARADGEVR